MTWPMVKLGEIAPAKPLKLVGLDENEQVLQVTLDNIESNSGRLIKKNYSKISEAGSSTHWFDSRYVLYSKLRPYLNKVLLPEEQGLGTTELVPMLPDPNRLCRKYLAHYLKSQKFVDWVSVQTAGAKMPRVSMKVFWDHEIPLPPLEEQKRIAAILDKADAIRRKRQQAIELADDFLRSVFLDMFGDPVTNPKGWEVKTVAELISDGVIIQVQDGNHGNDHPKVADFVSSGVPFVTANVIRRGKILFQQCYYLEDEWLEKLRIGFAKPRDVLISHKGSLGFTAVLDHTYENYIFSPQATYYRLDESRMIPEYLKGYFDSGYFQNLFAKEGIQSTRAYLGITRQKDLPIMIPPLSEQEQYVKALSVYGNAYNKLVNLNDYSNLFSALSQKAFSGEL